MTDELRITSNHIPRPLWSFYDMPKRAQDDHDYVREQERYDDAARFFEYRGNWYDIYEFMHADRVEGWDAYFTDSFFSSILIRFTEDNEQVVVGLALT